MATRLNGDTLRWLDTLNNEGSFAEMSDGRLLERFLAQTGAASEVAFEVLVRRHGPMVLSFCRGVLHDDHAAADAFQATFLVLARRASTIRDRDHLAPWLGRVARRIARSSRTEEARRAARERRIAVSVAKAAPAAVEFDGLEIASLVRAEVDRLPKVDRLLLQLTYWQGKTYEEAAALLSWPIGTVRSRLSRVRERLRGRLARQGLAPILAVTGSAALIKEASAAQPPEALVMQTVRAATMYAGEMTAAALAGAVPATVAALVNGELSTMADNLLEVDRCPVAPRRDGDRRSRVAGPAGHRRRNRRAGEACGRLGACHPDRPARVAREGRQQVTPHERGS